MPAAACHSFQIFVDIAEHIRILNGWSSHVKNKDTHNIYMNTPFLKAI